MHRSPLPPDKEAPGWECERPGCRVHALFRRRRRKKVDVKIRQEPYSPDQFIVALPRRAALVREGGGATLPAPQVSLPPSTVTPKYIWMGCGELPNAAGSRWLAAHVICHAAMPLQRQFPEARVLRGCSKRLVMWPGTARLIGSSCGHQTNPPTVTLCTRPRPGQKYLDEKEKKKK